MNWYELITIESWLKGLKFFFLISSLKFLFSRIIESKKNLSKSSWFHCFRRFAGQMIKILFFFSAHFWEINKPASIVFPKPTSSARIAPLERGDLKAKRAASIWWGLRSTWASNKVVANFSKLLEAHFLVSWWAKYLAWYLVNEIIYPLIFSVSLS